MTIMQALILALWAGFCSYDDQGPQMLRRPLLIGPVVGIVLGDLTSALIISATLELMWMGLGNMAGYKTPDMIIGTIVGISVSITSGTGASTEGIAAGVAAATTVAILAQQLLLVFDFVRQLFVPWADKIALSGKFDGLMKINIVSILFQFSIRAIPTFIVVYLQGDVVDKILKVIPENILGGLGTASRILPAIGLSILMTMMMKGFLWPFLIFGFVLSTYLGLGILPTALVSLAIAMLYSLLMEIKDRQNETAVLQTKTSSQQVDEDEGYDL